MNEEDFVQRELSDNGLQAIINIVWGIVCFAGVIFLCLAQKNCTQSVTEEHIVNAKNRPELYRAQTEGCRNACGNKGVREVTEDKCTCD